MIFEMVLHNSSYVMCCDYVFNFQTNIIDTFQNEFWIYFKLVVEYKLILKLLMLAAAGGKIKLEKNLPTHMK